VDEPNQSTSAFVEQSARGRRAGSEVMEMLRLETGSVRRPPILESIVTKFPM